MFHALDQRAVPVTGGDGKCVRGSHDGKQSAIHLVSAWSSTSGLTLGQVKTADNSNEITAIPELLRALDIKGSIITVDAMGCQHDIAAKIVQSGADYVLGVKDNQLVVGNRSALPELCRCFSSQCAHARLAVWSHTSLYKYFGTQTWVGPKVSTGIV